jgi:hypothetical protein
MELFNFFLRLEKEFEIDFPDNREETMASVKEVCDFIRKEYARQGIECPSGMIFDRVRRLIGIMLRADEDKIRLNTRFADVLAQRSSAA